MATHTSSINKIFSYAVKRNASDVHIIVGKPPLVRVDGDLYEIEGISTLSAKAVKEMILEMLEEEQKKRFLEELELDFSYSINEARFRVNIHFERGYMGLAARIIANDIPSMKELDLPEIVYDLIRQKQGYILLTGPTGCGKSTSQAAMIRQINEERAVHIVTLEDPVEYIHEPVKSVFRQRQLGTDFHSFSDAMKHIVRQDPDVILVGEMRDLETMGTAITLAETGHLVLATLHTNSAAKTIDRIIDVFPPHQQEQVRMQLSMSLLGVISQRLLPKVGGGRVAAREIMINTPAVANMIRENKIAQLHMALETGKEEGMITMDQDIKRLFEQELIEEDTALSYMKNPKDL